jgi:hypothetical protein
MARKWVEAVFFDRKAAEADARHIPLPTTTGGSATAGKIACNDYAWDNGMTHWAQHDPVRGEWLLFECMGRSSRAYLGAKPTREAAEMWLVHLG